MYIWSSGVFMFKGRWTFRRTYIKHYEEVYCQGVIIVMKCPLYVMNCAAVFYNIINFFIVWSTWSTFSFEKGIVYINYAIMYKGTDWISWLNHFIYYSVRVAQLVIDPTFKPFIKPLKLFFLSECLCWDFNHRLFTPKIDVVASCHDLYFIQFVSIA